ncbi:MAG: hypothetical protein R2781_07240 [Flavobacteriaceae bacterium]
MEPIKFEENIREKLQERELQPRKEAWAKLSAQLDAQQPKKTSNTLLWMAVAASFVGIFLVTTLFFNKEKQQTQLVAEPSVEVLEEDKQNQSEIASEENAIEVEKEEVIPETEDIIIPKTEVAKVLKTEKNKAVQKFETPKEAKETLAVNEVQKQTTLEKEKTNQEQFIDSKVDEVVVAVQKIQKENNAVTPDEIDALLAKAQRDIANNRILNANTQKVDATALLMDVETELERSFRDRVFDVLGEGFNKIRSAVAERNN